MAALRQSLLLLIIAESIAAFSIGQSIFRVAKSPGDHYIVAPELFRYETFAFARVEKLGRSPHKLGVDVQIVNRTFSKKCSLNLSPETGAVSVGVVSIRRLAWTRVLIVAYDEYASGERKVVTILLNLFDCTFIYPYSKVFPAAHTIFTTNSIRDDRYRFMIVVTNNKFCFPRNSCAITVMINLAFNEIEAFDVDLDPESVNIEPLSVSVERHLFVVRGLDDTGTYRFLLYDTQERPAKRMELLSLANATSMQIISSNLAICWINRPGEDTMVHCSKFSVNGSVIFNKTVIYQEAVRISFVQNTFLGLLLFSSKSRCEGTDCWIIYISTMSEDDQASELRSYHTSRFECVGDRKQLAIFKARKDVGSIQAEYVCDNNNEFTFNVIGVTDQHV